MKRTCLAAWLALGALAASDALAYEVNTHARMTTKASQASALPARLKDIAADQKLFSLGNDLSDGGIYLFGFTVFELHGTVADWLSDGAIHEDDWCCIARFRNHFFNPLNGQGYSYGVLSGKPSLLWGLEPTDQFAQDYSYRDARQYFYDGITASTERQRKANLSKMFRSTGQVAHLIEDLGQPQHTRNDSHGTGSRYEKYTDQARDRLVYDGYPAVKVTTPDQFWTTGPGGKGLADYTNQGFVTDGTNFTGTRIGNTIDIQPAANLPSPNGVGATIVKKQITDPDLLDAVGPNQPLTGEIWFVATTVTDNNQPGMTGVNGRTSTFSIFDEDLSRYGWSWTFTQNRFNFDAAHSFLIPRAVGYAAGLINYFYRGQMEIGAPDDIVWSIIDPTQNSGFAQIKLKVRNTTPGEDMAGGQLWAVAKFHLNTCYRSDLSGEANGPNGAPVGSMYRTCRSADESMVMSAPKTVTLRTGDPAQEMSFNFGQTPIPVNATDLFIQLVYRGRLGSEDNAVAVATTDVFEPTHVAFMNATDVSEINDKFYTFDQVTAGIASGDPTFAAIDLNRDHVYSPFGGDWNVNPIDYGNVSISFVGPNQRVVGTIASLPHGRFVRIAYLTDKPGVSFFPGFNFFTPPSAFNQLSDDRTTYYVTPVFKLRGDWVMDGDIIFYCIPGTTCNGNLLTIPDSNATNATTPLQVTITQQFP